MIVTLDGRRLDREFPEGCTLHGLVEQLQSELDEGRLFISVAVDGRPYGEAELEAAMHTPLGTETQVDFESGDRYTLAREALTAIAAELTSAGERQPAAAEQLQAGHATEAVAEVGQLVQTWLACRDGIVQCSRLVGCDLTQVEFEGRLVAEHLSDLVDQLREVRDALDARDMVLLGDLLHYELPELCRQWSALLMHLAGNLGTHSKAQKSV